MFQTSRNKWRHEAIRRLDCLINQFLLGKYEAKVKLFSSSPFSLLTHFYCSTRMPSLANNFRQEKNLFRRVNVNIFNGVTEDLVYPIYDHEFQFLSLYLKSEILCVIRIN